MFLFRRNVTVGISNVFVGGSKIYFALLPPFEHPSSFLFNSQLPQKQYILVRDHVFEFESKTGRLSQKN